MSEIEELYEALEEAREADQVASACVLYEEILTQEDSENAAETLLYVDDLIDFGNFDQAEATLGRVSDLDSSDEFKANHSFCFGNLYEQLGRFAEAEKKYREAHERTPSRGAYLVLAASMAFQQSQPARAEHLVREALKYNCDRDEAYGNLGGYLASQRRFSEAIKAYEEVLKIDPEDKNAREWIEDLEHLVD